MAADRVAWDHIWVDRGAYTHHGIDLGDNEVVHYGPQGGRSKKAIGVTTRADFACGSRIQVEKYDHRLPVHETVHRALGRLNENGYALILNNCEHFATWCVQGYHTSWQVDRVRLGAAWAWAS